jgi:hypothetical protein
MKQRKHSERANKVQHFLAPKVDGSKFGSGPREGILEISYFTDRVRLKLSMPQVSSKPLVDEEVTPEIYEQTKDILTRGCTLLHTYILSKTTGIYYQTIHTNNIKQ